MFGIKPVILKTAFIVAILYFYIKRAIPAKLQPRIFAAQTASK